MTFRDTKAAAGNDAITFNHCDAGGQLACVPAVGFAESKQRLIVLSDIEADPDDSQSLVRLLLYANQIDIEGIVATTSTHQKSRIAPESMHAIIDAGQAPVVSKTETAHFIVKVTDKGSPALTRYRRVIVTFTMGDGAN